MKRTGFGETWKNKVFFYQTNTLTIYTPEYSWKLSKYEIISVMHCIQHDNANNWHTGGYLVSGNSEKYRLVTMLLPNLTLSSHTSQKAQSNNTVIFWICTEKLMYMYSKILYIQLLRRTLLFWPHLMKNVKSDFILKNKSILTFNNSRLNTQRFDKKINYNYMHNPI